MSTLTRQQAQRMRAGRDRASRQRRREAIARVRAFNKWLKAGSPLRQIPSELPTDRDFKVWREMQR